MSAEKISGIFLDVLSGLERRLNFTTRLLLRRDLLFGYFTNGSWNGMIGNAVKGEADFIAASLTMNVKRFEVLDFLLPIGTETAVFYIPREGFEGNQWTSFLHPLKPRVWICLTVNSLALLLGLKILQRCYNSSKPRANNERDVFRGIRVIMGDWWMLFASYFGRGPTSNIDNKRGTIRALLFLVFLTGNIVCLSYKASLTAKLSVRRRSLPFESIEELIKSDFRYKPKERYIQTIFERITDRKT